MKCSFCQAEVPPGERFCPSCKVEIPANDLKPPNKCSKCGKVLTSRDPSGQFYCKECGLFVPRSGSAASHPSRESTIKAVCSHCGTAVSSSSQFCPQCGTKIPVGSPPANSQAPARRSKGIYSPKFNSISRILLMVALSLLFLVILLVYAANKYESSAASKISFKLFDEDLYDAPVKTQVVQKIIVSGEITSAGLRGLLDKIYQEQSRRTGFRYHSTPTHIFLYAYLDRDRAASGQQWIAMLDKTVDSSAEITIKEDQIVRLSEPETERFGLSEKIRGEVYREIWRLNSVARKETDEGYPITPSQSLKAGDTFRLTKETPLMPEFEPTDFSAAMSRIRQIPPGATIEVIEVHKKDNTPWYLVRASADSNDLGGGWINSIALLGQDQEDTQQRMAKFQQAKTEMTDRYWGKLAEKYGLTRAQLDEIWEEGFSKDWPNK